MPEPTYCPKCKKWNVFGEPNDDYSVQEQMKKEGIKGISQDLFAKDKKKFGEDYSKYEYYKLRNKYLEQNKFIEAGCIFMDTCCVCHTKLIEK